MTPALPSILAGQARALGMPMPPEAAGEYFAGRMGLMILVSALAAQEAERGVAARVWENAAIRALFGKAANHDQDGKVAAAAAQVDSDLAWSALDSANAVLRRLLIELHEAVEKRGDVALERDILTLYQDMARARRLELPAALFG